MKNRIGGRIKIIRGTLRQDVFAEKVGVSLNTVGRWERNQRTPDADDLNKILAAFPETSPAWLLTGEGDSERKTPDVGLIAYTGLVVNSIDHLIEELSKNKKELADLLYQLRGKTPLAALLREREGRK